MSAKIQKILINTKNYTKNTLKTGKNGLSYLQTVVFPDVANRFCLARKSANPLLLVIRYSIDSPYILHRYSIVSMDYRWRNDGVTMEYLRRKSGITREEQEICNYGTIESKYVKKRAFWWVLLSDVWSIQNNMYLCNGIIMQMIICNHPIAPRRGKSS